MDVTLWAAPLAGLAAAGAALVLATSVMRADPGNARMQKIGAAIQQGAMAFLRAEYRVLVVFVAIIAALIAIVGFTTSAMNPWTAVAFVAGAVTSVAAGYAGMYVATRANMRTAQAARNGMPAALRIAFSGGAVMGLTVVGLGLSGVGLLTIIFGRAGVESGIINGFALGASSIALFARVGGGIYTKAADVGADLVGKVEAGIPEDDPRNPAVIADNVGDNVGDVAGMGADLYESYVGSIIATMALAVLLPNAPAGLVTLPLLVAAAGIVASLAGVLVVRGLGGSDPAAALRYGTFAAGGVTIVLVAAISLGLYQSWAYLAATATGLIAGIVIGWRLALRLADTRPRVATRADIDDFVTWVTLGIILGGRLGKRRSKPLATLFSAGFTHPAPSAARLSRASCFQYIGVLHRSPS